MRNKIRSIQIGICITASLSLIGCSSSRQLNDSHSKRQRSNEPQFLDGISLDGGGHNKLNTTSTASSGSSRRNNSNTSGNINGKGLQRKYADMLGIAPQHIQNFSLYDFIEDWYGVRYRSGGDDKAGVDCSGFVKRLYEHVFSTDLLRTAFEQFNNCRIVKEKDDLQEGDLVFFRTHGKRISHVGVYLANYYFVHASTSKGVIISSLNEDYWKRYYAGAGYIPKR